MNNCGHETFMGQCIDCLVKTEEETKVDELKVYTGKETLQTLLEGKTLESKPQKYQYKFTDKLMTLQDDKTWTTSIIGFNNVMALELTEVITPQVGDWVKFKFKGGTHTAKIEKIDSEGYWGEWNQPTSDITTPIYPYEYVTFEILSPEEVSEYKREQAFAKVGRKLNEFKANDIVYIEAVNRTAIVVSSKNETEIRLHSINVGEAGHTAKPYQLTPVCFVDHMVDLS